MSFLGDAIEKCSLGLFADSDFAGGLDSAKSTSGIYLVLFGEHTFAPVAAVSRRQKVTSHSTSESETVALDLGLRQEGLPALN